MPNPGRNNIYAAVIKRMVNEALDNQEKVFASSCDSDSDEQLVAYLQSCACLLGHTPWPREIVGGKFLEKRFGSWENALIKAKLPPPAIPDKLTAFARYQEEVERQKIVYREKKTAKKQKAQKEKQKK